MSQKCQQSQRFSREIHQLSNKLDINLLVKVLDRILNINKQRPSPPHADLPQAAK